MSNAAAFLETNKEIAQQLENAIRERVGLKSPSAMSEQATKDSDDEKSLLSESERPARRGPRKAAVLTAPESVNGAES
jgi:recombination DNA repair RAD52 pathway protein